MVKEISNFEIDNEHNEYNIADKIADDIAGGITDAIDEIGDGIASSFGDEATRFKRIHSVAEKHPLIRQAVTYMFFGAIASFIDIAIFMILILSTGIDPLYANIISVSIGLSVSFVLNRWKTFDARDHVPRRITCFFIVGFIGMSISEMILALLSEAGIDTLLAKIFAILIAGSFQFVSNKLISFR